MLSLQRRSSTTCLLILFGSHHESSSGKSGIKVPDRLVCSILMLIPSLDKLLAPAVRLVSFRGGT